jgi:site-specific DNA-methyltransferase (adenine-specific)
MILHYADSMIEAESYKSFIGSKFCTLAFKIAQCSTFLCDEMWRFIPDPGAFDHIFTDEELYEKYNLTEEEINIIESVIKERK